MMAGSRDLSLFVFIDALGWELLQRHRFLDGILQTRSPLQTVFGYSCTCDPTILTGLQPADHGHFSFFYYAPEKSPFRLCRPLRFLPKELTRRGRVRRQISRLIQAACGYDGYFQIYNVPFQLLPLFDYSEKKDLYRPGGIINGQPTIFDHLRERRIPFCVSDWRKGEKRNLLEMQSELSRGECSFAYLYLAELDGILHAEGTGSPRVADKIAWYDRQLRQLLAHAKTRYDEVRLYVFSDHGMTDVVSDFDLIAEVDRLGFRFGHDYAAAYDSTMARFWFFDERTETRVRRMLESMPCGRVLEDTELRELGTYFPDGKYGELFFLLDPGVLMCPSFMNEKHMAGMHGYHPSHPDSIASFASSERMAETPRRLENLYSLMRIEADRGSVAPVTPPREAYMCGVGTDR
jgi:predicted AlkP superfamily pyrophosphatase or phosphodiesterase